MSVEMISGLMIDVRGDVRGLEKAVTRSKSLLRGLEKSMNKTSTNLTKMGKTMSLKVTAPIVAFGAASVAAFAKFDHEMTKSLSIMGTVSKAQRNELEKTARVISEELPFAASQAAEAYYFLASAGLDVNQSISAMPTVAKFATAGAFDLATATDLLTDAQTALGLSYKDPIKYQKEMIRIGDVLAKATTLANASTRQFAEGLTNKLAVAGHMVGKDVEELTSILAALADKGYAKGIEGGEKAYIILRDLQTAYAKAGDTFKKFGVQVYDSAGNMNHIADIIEDMENSFAGLSAEQIKARMGMMKFQDRSMIAIQALMGMSPKLRKFDAELRKAAGTMSLVAEKQMKSFTNQLKILKNKLTNTFAEFGAVVIPHLVKFMKVLGKGLQVVRQFSDGTKKTIMVVLSIAASIGPVLIGLGLAIKMVSVALGGLSVLLSPVALTIGLVIIAVTALTAAIVYLVGTGKGTARWMDGIIKVFTAIELASLYAVKGFHAFMEGFDWFTTIIGNHLYDVYISAGRLWEVLKGVGGWFKTIWEDAKVYIGGIITMLKTAIGLKEAFSFGGKTETNIKTPMTEEQLAKWKTENAPTGFGDYAGNKVGEYEASELGKYAATLPTIKPPESQTSKKTISTFAELLAKNKNKISPLQDSILNSFKNSNQKDKTPLVGTENPFVGVGNEIDKITKSFGGLDTTLTGVQAGLGSLDESLTTVSSAKPTTDVSGLSDTDWNMIKKYQEMGANVSIMSAEQYANKHQSKSSMESTYSSNQTGGEKTGSDDTALLQAIERNTAAMAVFSG